MIHLTGKRFVSALWVLAVSNGDDVDSQAYAHIEAMVAFHPSIGRDDV